MSQSANNTPESAPEEPSTSGNELLPIAEPSPIIEMAPIPALPIVDIAAEPVAETSPAPVLPEASHTIPEAPLYVEPVAGLPVSPTLNEEPSRKERWKALSERISVVARNAGLILALGVAIFVFLQQVNTHYPIKHWLFWTYAKIWGYCALFALAITSSGHLVVKAIGKRLPLAERWVVALACGTLVYFGAMFLCGLFGIYNRVFAIVLPIVLFLPGSVSLVRHGRRAIRHLRGALARTTWRPSPLFWVIAAFGGLGIGMIYFAILSPRNMAYDSYYYHLGIAQQYTVQGGIKPALEGWLPAAIPHLASVLYTWAFLLPGLNMFERVVCAAHVEFVLFLFTLMGVPVLVRKLVPRASAGLAWASFFLFPGIFVYDSALSVAADHVNAFWAIPLYLMLLRTLRSLDVIRTGGANAARNVALLSAFAAGALLTKYQAMYLIAYPALALVGAVFWQFGRTVARRRDLLWPMTRTILATLGTGLVVSLLLTAPHWLKNWVWYGDPFFPYLSSYMLSPKWVPDTAVLFQGWDNQHTNWRPSGTLAHKLTETAQGMALFAFQPHDWAKFHGRVPIFGALFTLSALLLPFLRNTKRIWGLFVATELGIAVWYWTLHQDRYLQALLPWMACTVAATLICLWRAHWTAKPLAALLVGVQVVWGGDAYFIPAHAMTGNSAAPITVELFAQGMKGKYSERYAFGDRLFEIGRDAALPPDAHVLVHEHELRFGLWRPVISDQPGLAYAYRYEFLQDSGEVYSRLRQLEVTHFITRLKSFQIDSLGSDLQFFAFVKREGKLIKEFSDWGLYSLPATQPTRKLNNVVAYLGCGNQYARGLHKLSSLSVRERQVVKKPGQIQAMTPMPVQPQDFAAFIAQADFLVTDNKCKPPAPAEASQGFVQMATRGDSEVLWTRMR